MDVTNWLNTWYIKKTMAFTRTDSTISKTWIIQANLSKTIKKN